MPRPVYSSIIAVVLCLLTADPADASFHLMQIEQVIGGVEGDTSAQAIQLRMRFPGDGTLPFARIRAWDEAGANPITLIDFDMNVPNNRLGDRILVASPGFFNYTEPSLTADFALSNAIPASYLDAGRITYEGDDGVIYWSLSFGGQSYTGQTTGSAFNDTDGEFGPSFDGPLPSGNLSALLFQRGAIDLSTSNIADYALTTGPAVFTNNLGISSVVVPEPGSIALLALGSTLLIRRRRKSD